MVLLCTGRAVSRHRVFAGGDQVRWGARRWRRAPLSRTTVTYDKCHHAQEIGPAAAGPRSRDWVLSLAVALPFTCGPVSAGRSGGLTAPSSVLSWGALPLLYPHVLHSPHALTSARQPFESVCFCRLTFGGASPLSVCLLAFPNMLSTPHCLQPLTSPFPVTLCPCPWLLILIPH